MNVWNSLPYYVLTSFVLDTNKFLNFQKIYGLRVCSCYAPFTT